MPLMVTFFNVRKGRDALFKRGMRHLFPRTARRYASEYGIHFVGWFNVTEGSTWDNVIILDLPNYAVLDFLYDATEQLRRFFESNRERLREVGQIKLADDDQDFLVYHPVDETWTTRLTYQDPADHEWYDEEQVVDSVAEVIEL